MKQAIPATIHQKPSTKPLRGSCIHCREGDRELVLYLAPRPARALRRAIPILLVVAGIVWFFAREGLPVWAAIGIGLFLSVAFFFIFAGFVGPHLTKTFVRITPDRLVLATVDYGKDAVQEHVLSDQSHAQPHWVRRRHGSSWIQGIDVTLPDGTAHFGAALTLGEVDWLEWRINRFLRPTADEAAPSARMVAAEAAMAPVPELDQEPIAPPEDTKVRLERDAFETRIHFPNTVQAGSYSGTGRVLFGFVWSGVFLYGMLQSWGQRHGTATVIFSGIAALFGLLFLITGLGRLFGRRLLTISPEKITYRAALLGIGPGINIPTADVITYGSTKGPGRSSKREPGPSKGHVIRSATREIRYSEQLRDAARTKAEADWLAGEIVRSIQEARSIARGGKAEPIPSQTQSPAPASRERDRRESPRVLPFPPLPSPVRPVPYGLDRRPMPAGRDLETLLPAQVGPFRRQAMDRPDEVRNTIIEADYRLRDGGLLSFGGGISVALGIYEHPNDAQLAIAVARTEVSADNDLPDDQWSLKTEPSFCQTTTSRGAFIAWTRGGYYFSAHAPGGEADLNRFMQFFPY